MFEVEVNEGSSKSDKLLFNIQSLLKEQNELLKQAFSMPNTLPVIENKIENMPNIKAMERKELIAFIKTLPKGTITGKYMTLSLEELRKTVKEVL